MYVLPDIGIEKAAGILAKKPGLISRKRAVLKTELVYVPSYLFLTQVEVKPKRMIAERISVDALRGEFALFDNVRFGDPPAQPFRTAEFAIGRDEALALATDQYRRHLLRKSMKLKSACDLKTIALEKAVYYPFYVGYFQRRKGLDFDVIDGVSAHFQGVRMRGVFIDLLLANRTAGPVACAGRDAMKAPVCRI